MLLTKLLLISWPILFNGHSIAPPKKIMICYGKIAPRQATGHDVLVLEGNHYTKEDIAKFKMVNRKVMAYISTTEVNENAPYFEEIRPYILQKHENWDSYYLNLNDSETIGILLHEADKLMEMGFDGLFLDTVDNVADFGPLKNQKNAFLRFLNSLKEKHQDSFIVQNAGLSLLEKTHGQIDLIAVESVMTAYDFEKKSYNLRPKKDRKPYIAQILQLRKKYKKPFFLIEYTDSRTTAETVKKLAKTYKLGLFIAQIDLNCPYQFH